MHAIVGAEMWKIAQVVCHAVGETIDKVIYNAVIFSFAHCFVVQK